eukprot:COSAG04_NODE_1591_length_6214_cov_29.260095_3_plen_178_part_00
MLTSFLAGCDLHTCSCCSGTRCPPEAVARFTAATDRVYARREHGSYAADGKLGATKLHRLRTTLPRWAASLSTQPRFHPASAAGLSAHGSALPRAGRLADHLPQGRWHHGLGTHAPPNAPFLRLSRVVSMRKAHTRLESRAAGEKARILSVTFWRKLESSSACWMLGRSTSRCTTRT